MKCAAKGWPCYLQQASLTITEGNFLAGGCEDLILVFNFQLAVLVSRNEAYLLAALPAH